MPRLVAFTTPTGETVHINPALVDNVHEVFETDAAWKGTGTRTVILYDAHRVQGVREDFPTVLKRLAGDE